jgi:hypothetical protein
MKITTVMLLLVSLLSLLNCKKESPAPAATAPAVTAPVQARPVVVPPTAEEAYRLQDDCTRRGEKILKNNVVRQALTQEQVSRYNPVTNRCYVRLEVHAADLSEWNKFENGTYFYDGQTGEMLAFFRINPDGRKAYLGFDCGGTVPYEAGFDCVSAKVAACMSGRDCEP